MRHAPPGRPSPGARVLPKRVVVLLSRRGRSFGGLRVSRLFPAFPALSLPPSSSRSAGAAALVFSTTDRASFEAISKWHRKVLDECGPIAMCMCQNKIDLVDDEAAEVAPGEPEALAEALGVKLYRVCVREDFNVDRVFLHLARLWSRDPGLLADDAETGADATPSGGGTRARAGGFASTPGTERTMEEMATPAHATRDDGGGGGGGFGWQAAAVRSPAFSPGGGVHSGTPRRGAGAALAELLAERERAAAAEGVVRLGPSTRRTGGKKRLTARVTSKCAQGG